MLAGLLCMGCGIATPSDDGGLVPADVANDGSDDAGAVAHALACTASSLVTIPFQPALEIGPTATMEMWVRPRAPGIIMAEGDPSTSARFLISLDDPQTLFVGWIASGTRFGISYYFAVGAFALGVWHHLAVVQEDAGGFVSMSLIVDGVSLLPQMPGPPDSQFALAGSGADLRFCMFEGDIDEVRLWSFARSLSEIQANMRDGVASAPGLTASFRLEEDTQTVGDASGNRLDGVLGESATVEPSDPVRISDQAF